MKKIFSILFLTFLITIICFFNKKPNHFEPKIFHTEFSILPIWDVKYQTAISQEYESGPVDDSELEGVQCPIPMKDRVRNYTGIQCVFSSLECLARWAECKNLLEPIPLTSRSGCKSFSSPKDAAVKLKKFGVKFEQSYQNTDEGIELIKKSMSEGRGVLWGVPGHAMVLCHYDENKNVVKWIDNSDKKLRIQTTTVDSFKKRWNGWVLAIYAEPDLFPDKMITTNLANQIPIIDRSGNQGKYEKGYIPTPQK